MNLCKCGCGALVAGEWKIGHHWAGKRALLTPPNPSGICQCGCGGVAPIATATVGKYGHLKGHPMRFIYGHHCGAPMNPEGPNPSGLCMCGCGKKTSLATISNRKTGAVRGTPMRYIHNHHNRPEGPPYIVEDRGYKTLCWVWQWYVAADGYGQMYYEGKNMGAHRAYYMKFKGAIPEGYDIDHLCFTTSCVNPDHLEAVTPRLNHSRRRFIRLSFEKAPVILQLREWGCSYSAIGGLFGVKAGAIYQLCAGNTWKDEYREELEATLLPI